MVGTRHPTPYGSGMAERLACDLASQGLVIISGMARGVDTASHRGAISAKGKTVAVFGTGVDVIYPKENKSLAEQIVSSAPPGALKAAKWNLHAHAAIDWTWNYESLDKEFQQIVS